MNEWEEGSMFATFSTRHWLRVVSGGVFLLRILLFHSHHRPTFIALATCLRNGHDRRRWSIEVAHASRVVDRNWRQDRDRSHGRLLWLLLRHLHGRGLRNGLRWLHAHGLLLRNLLRHVLAVDGILAVLVRLNWLHLLDVWRLSSLLLIAIATHFW